MYYYNYLLPGDTVKSLYQTRYFHKNETYEISKVFYDNNKFRVFIKDKNGFDTEVKYSLDQYFKLTTATLKAEYIRYIHCKIDLMIEDRDIVLIHSVGPYNDKKENFYHIYNSIGSGSKGDFHILTLIKNNSKVLEVDIKNNPSEINKIYDFLIKENGKDGDDHFYYNWTLKDVNRTVSDNLVHKTFLLKNNIISLNKDKLNLPLFIDEEFNRKYYNNLDLYKSIDKLNYMLFDNNIATPEQVEFYGLILDAYMVAPPTYGATAISKIFGGKAKTVPTKLEPFVLKNPLNLKYERIFVVVDELETMCYGQKAFLNAGDRAGEQGVTFNARSFDLDKINEIKNVLSCAVKMGPTIV